MRVCKDIILTVKFNHPECSYDMEMPAFMSIENLKQKLLETIKAMDPASFGKFSKIELSINDNSLEDESHLAGYGIWDGNIIDAELS